VTPLTDFVRRVLNEGEAVLRTRPAGSPADRASAARLLAKEFDSYRREVAGPPVDFDETAAVAAAEWLWLGCWFLVDHAEPAAEVVRLLPEPGTPRTPAAHLSADLLLRFLPQAHRRARAVADVLATWTTSVLRRWPLAGVLAEVVEAPLTDLGFGGHPGLRLLYAERLAEHPRIAWVPPATVRDHAELVFTERGLVLPSAVPAVGNK
jgi:hypothetical protein